MQAAEKPLKHFLQQLQALVTYLALSAPKSWRTRVNRHAQLVAALHEATAQINEDDTIDRAQKIAAALEYVSDHMWDGHQDDKPWLAR